MRFLPLVLASVSGLAQAPFLTAPYLQLGEAPSPSRLELVWHSKGDGVWSVELKGPKGWLPTQVPRASEVAVGAVPSHQVWRVALERLRPAQAFTYRVKKDGQVVFEASGRGLPGGQAKLRAVVFGDGGQGTPEQGAIARQALNQNPDLVVLTGDLVYGRGRASEYATNFFPYYNGAAGAPLLRSVPIAAAPGNHDIPTTDINNWPDGLAYFYYWFQPLNGPLEARPPLDPQKGKAILDAAGARFPRMGNFSFDAGPVHWTVLDSNPYVDWLKPELQAWLEKDLKGAKAAWKIVVCHHPAFNAADSHASQQWMRLLLPLLERNGVDLLLSGHVHNYQRSKPVRFTPERDAGAKVWDRKGAVEGQMALDQAFDGQRRTRANGIVHVISGAGGAALYNPEQGADRSRWQPWTAAFVSDVHSLTVLDVDPKTLVLRQVDAAGKELDSVTLRQ